jgi:hypothetical protein
MVYQKVLIAVVTGEYARRADFYDYFHLLKKPDNTYHLLCHDRSPAKGRNLAIGAAQDEKCTHILFIDDDMAYPPNSLLQLLEHDKEIVSGLYLGRQYPHPPVVFDIASEDGAAFPMYLTEEPGLYPIVAAGFGFLLIKMSIFEKLEKPYVRLGELDNEQWCDDIGFFHRVRKAGIQSYCDTNVCIGHMGTIIMWPDYKNGKWGTSYDTNGSGKVFTPQFDPDMKYKFVEVEK